jgi:hypothetical protein
MIELIALTAPVLLLVICAIGDGIAGHRRKKTERPYWDNRYAELLADRSVKSPIIKLMAERKAEGYPPGLHLPPWMREENT